MTINNTPNLICRGTDTHKYIHTHKYLVHYSGISSHSFLVDCCLFLPPPLLLPQVSSSPPYLSLNSKMENTVVKIVSYQYIPNWNYLLFNWVLSWWHCVTYWFALEPNNIQYFKQSIPFWNNMTNYTYIGIQYWKKQTH